MTPQVPCRDCPDRHAGCHNDTCPHGWAEYEAAHKEYLEKRADFSIRGKLCVTEGRAKKRQKYREKMKKRRK